MDVTGPFRFRIAAVRASHYDLQDARGELAKIVDRPRHHENVSGMGSRFHGWISGMIDWIA
jgi:hypothetical protein